MKNKIILNPEVIIKEYKDGIGIEKLALKYHVGKLKIKDILFENGIELKKKGGQKKEINYIINDWKIEKYPMIDGYYYVAIFKEDNKEFNDYMNKAGYLTSYIEEKIGIKTPTLYDRRKYYMETGNYWWEQWFKIEKRENKKMKKCPYCGWKTIDIENKSGVFEQHLKEEHSISIEEYLKDYPEDSFYFQKYIKNKKKKELLLNDENYIICPICNEKLEKMTYWHLKNKHNMTVNEFKLKYPNFNILSQKAYKQASEAFKEANLHVSKNKFVSSYEKEIQDFLDKNNIKYESSRQFLIGQEIDILINDKKIGIEFNGLKWHTEWFGKKERNYHLNKTIKCNEKKYGLIHIFEDEYVNNKEIVYNKLSHILHINNSPIIGARKCNIREIHKYDAEDFLNKNHIQGFTSATIYIGAYYEDKLISVMNFKKGNLKNKGWELNRFATDINYKCPGIGGKLFNYFIKKYNPIKIISFADRRWTINIENNLYTKLGFNIEKIGNPDYKYYNEKVDRYKRFHKMGFNKTILNKKYGLPITMTETEMVKELGYDRVWDCGLIKYVWKKE